VSRFARRPIDRPLLLVLGVAFLVRVVVLLWGSRGAPDQAIMGDQYQYWRIGQDIAAGRGYRAYLSDRYSAYYPVGWPLIIAGTTKAVDVVGLDRFAATGVALVQLALGVAIVWFVYLLAEAAVDRRTALVAAALVALFPSLVFSVATFSVESAFMAGYLGSLVIIVRHPWSEGAPSTRRTVAFGLAIGFAAQVRPFALPMLLGIGVAALVAGLGWRTALRAVGIALGCALIVFIPWTIRNAARLDAFVPSSTNLGDTMCMSRFPGSDASFHWADHEYCADPLLPEVERNGANVRAALRFVRDHPSEEVRLVGARFQRMWGSDTVTLDEVTSNWGIAVPSTERLPALAFLTDAYYWSIIVLGVPGIVLLALRRPNPPALSVLAVAGATLQLIPLGLWGALRFHIPLLPLLCIAAAATVVEAANVLRRRPASAAA
jgi:4-amino-4-deoxy-L-arabinose transferase-like glycosyltransferase